MLKGNVSTRLYQPESARVLLSRSKWLRALAGSALG
jgi:hypothetical protein